MKSRKERSYASPSSWLQWSRLASWAVACVGNSGISRVALVFLRRRLASLVPELASGPRREAKEVALNEVEDGKISRDPAHFTCIALAPALIRRLAGYT